MKKFDPSEHCPKCGDGDPAGVHWGWKPKYIDLRTMVDIVGGALSDDNTLECRCGQCGFIQLRKTLDAEV